MLGRHRRPVSFEKTTRRDENEQDEESGPRGKEADPCLPAVVEGGHWFWLHLIRLIPVEHLGPLLACPLLGCPFSSHMIIQRMEEGRAAPRARCVGIRHARCCQATLCCRECGDASMLSVWSTRHGGPSAGPSKAETRGLDQGDHGTKGIKLRTRPCTSQPGLGVRMACFGDAPNIRLGHCTQPETLGNAEFYQIRS